MASTYPHMCAGILHRHSCLGLCIVPVSFSWFGDVLRLYKTLAIGRIWVKGTQELHTLFETCESEIISKF
jgi:hypothetical protein